MSGFENQSLTELMAASNVDLSGTMGFLATLIKTPEQQEMLSWMMQQKQETLIPFLRNAISQIPIDAIPELIQQNMPDQSDEVKNQLHSQITTAYQFLANTSAEGAPPALPGPQ